MSDPLSHLVYLGDPRLYEVCEPVKYEELPMISLWVNRLNSVMDAIRSTYGFGRGIAAPQLGIMKRLFYIDIDRPVVVINPEITYYSVDTFELWDDCMSLPNLLVKVRRHCQIKMSYLDIHWKQQTWEAEGDVSELLQHEYDHLNGVLCTMRALDQKSFRWKPTLPIK